MSTTAAALIKARAELGTVSKDGKAPQIIGGYKFVSYDTFVTQAEAALAKAGLRVVPSILSVEERLVRSPAEDQKSKMYRTTVTMELTVMPESPGDPFVFRWAGTGDDTSDKGLQKAATSAYKYALMKLLMVAGEDDADAMHPTVNEQTVTEAIMSEFPGARVTHQAPPDTKIDQYGAAVQEDHQRTAVVAAPEVAAPSSAGGRAGEPPSTLPTTTIRKRRAGAQEPTSVTPLLEQPEPVAPDVNPDDIPY